MTEVTTAVKAAEEAVKVSKVALNAAPGSTKIVVGAALATIAGGTALYFGGKAIGKKASKIKLPFRKNKDVDDPETANVVESEE